MLALSPRHPVSPSPRLPFSPSPRLYSAAVAITSTCKRSPSEPRQRASSSATGCEMCSRPSALMRRCAPPVRPMTLSGAPACAAMRSRRVRCASSKLTRTREGVSPKSSSVGREPAAQLDRRAEERAPERREAALGERDGEAAVRAVVRGLEQALLGGAQARRLHGALAFEVERGDTRARLDHLLDACAQRRSRRTRSPRGLVRRSCRRARRDAPRA